MPPRDPRGGIITKTNETGGPLALPNDGDEM
jgi:hypothetical protein